MKNVLLTTILILSFVSFGQDKPAYKIYSSKGKPVTYAKMCKALNEKDVVLFGELHNSAIAHWLQLELTKDLDKNRDLILGAEMFEADNQDELNDYLSEKINAKAFDTLARLWPNYSTDYEPLVNYSKDNKLPFVATNIPRRYANMVYKKGGFSALDSLTDEEKSWIAPLPITFDPELPQYKKVLEMMGEHGSPELVMAQAIKDATMASFILSNYKAGSLFLHYHGAFHSDYFEGILWYLQQQKSDLNYGTISTVTQEDINKLEDEYKNKADFIIVVDEDVTTTY